FCDRGPRSARGAVTAAPGIGGGAQARVRGLREMPLLQEVHVRADGELADEPQEIRREAAMRRPGSDRGLIARERGAEERPRLDRAAVDRLTNVRRRGGRTAVGERVAQ